MASGLAKTKRRIKAIQGTGKITKSMELIATVKVKRFLTESERESEYGKSFNRLVNRITSSCKKRDAAIFKYNEEAKDLYIIFSSDLGLCGSYNNDLFRYANSIVNDDSIIAPLGSKAIHHYIKDGNEDKVMRFYLETPINSLTYSKVDKVAQRLLKEFLDGRWRSVNLIHVEYKNSITFKPRVSKLFPLEIDAIPAQEDPNPPLFDEDPDELFESLLPLYASSWLYAKLLNSQLAEQASRRTAMDNANDNCDSLLEKLTLEYNKARQNAITQEITEVVSGSGQ